MVISCTADTRLGLCVTDTAFVPMCDKTFLKHEAAASLLIRNQAPCVYFLFPISANRPDMADVSVGVKDAS